MTFCATRQVIFPAIDQLAAGSMKCLQKLADAVDALVSPDPLRPRVPRPLFEHVYESYPEGDAGVYEETV